MVADEQTHTLPADREGLERFARFAGFKDRDAFAQTLLEHLRKVQRHYAQAVRGRAGAGRPACAVVSRRTPTTARRSTGSARWASQAAGGVGHGAALAGRRVSVAARRVRAHAFRRAGAGAARPSRRAPRIRTRALNAFDLFLGGLQRGARLFSLLQQNPDLVALIALTLGTAPRLADILARHPQAMDALLEPTFFGALPDEDKLEAELDAHASARRSTYEDFLDRAAHVRPGADVPDRRAHPVRHGVGRAGGRSVRAACRRRDPRAASPRSRRCSPTTHGRIRGQQTALLALGKLGGREMTATSDLDLIIVYDFDAEHPQSDGERPLYGAQYFARLTQRLISALSAQTNYGALYQVDMRLRPSGRSGPVATSLDAFAELPGDRGLDLGAHGADARARGVRPAGVRRARRAGHPRRAVPAARRRSGRRRCRRDARRRSPRRRARTTRWDLKYAAGGLVDLEFIAQYLQLVHAAEHPEILDTSTARVLDKAWRLGLLSAEDAEVLRPAARLYHNLTQILRLCLPGPFDPKAAGAGLLRLLCRGGRPAGFRHARRASGRDAAEGARELQADSRRAYNARDQAGAAARFV